MNYINAKSNTYPFVEVVLYSEIVRRSICAVNQSRFWVGSPLFVHRLSIVCPWYGMVFIYSTSLYIIYIAHHYNITQDAEREMHEVQYLYVAFP